MSKKSGCLEAIGEIIAEIILTLVFFGIGTLVMKLFGIELDGESTDGDLLILVGIGAIAAVIGLFVLAAWLVRRVTRRPDKEGKMRRVIVIGCPGAGKSTFSRELGRITGLPLYHLDMIWHKPDRTNVSREEFDSALGEIMDKDSWIIDGNYQRTLRTRLEACDTVFLFDLPTEECLAGAAERVGKPRPDMPWIEQELDPEFKEWIEGFSKTKLPEIYEMLSEQGKDKNTVIFKSRAEADAYLLILMKNDKNDKNKEDV